MEVQWLRLCAANAGVKGLIPDQTRAWSLGREDPLEKAMVTHSSILAWRIPWTEEPDRLQSIGSRRVGHNWVTSLSLHFTFRELRGPPRWLRSKESACQFRKLRRHGFNPWVGKIPWRRKWQPTPLFLPGKIPRTEEPGGVQSTGAQSWTWLSTYAGD